MAAATNPNTGKILAVTVGGPALLVWSIWAFFVVTMGASLVAAIAGS